MWLNFNTPSNILRMSLFCGISTVYLLVFNRIEVQSCCDLQVPQEKVEGHCCWFYSFYIRLSRTAMLDSINYFMYECCSLGEKLFIFTSKTLLLSLFGYKTENLILLQNISNCFPHVLGFSNGILNDFIMCSILCSSL